MKKIAIRPYKSSDKTALLNLIDLNTPKYFAIAEKADFENYLENERELYFVITSESEIIGCGGINFEEEKSTGIISWDIIHPDYQGKSYGKQLLNHRLDILKQMKSTQRIIVRTSQETNLFYEKTGFQLKKIVPNYWAEGFHLYLMEYEQI